MGKVLTIDALRTMITGSHVRTAEAADDEGITGQKSTRDIAIDIAKAFTNGTTDGKADLVFFDTHTLAGAATKEYDLAGVLTDPDGALITFVTVKAILLRSTLAANKVLSLTTPAANGFVTPFGAAQEVVKVNGEGWLCLVAPNTGYVVTADTGDLLDVVNAAGGNSTYDLVIIGTSA